ncbi:MAG TPA: alpha/beta hydrolase [Anaerolineae bacterium]|nr:alpha/beta hydrolase [Anaerolineae bacterium]
MGKQFETNMKKLFTLSFLLLILITACVPQTQANVDEASLALEECILTSPGGRQIDAECGVLIVPEDRANPEGRQIELHVAVIPAIKRNPQPDPLFMLAGGPGQSAIEAFPAMISLLRQIHEDRDIVLVDQRGTGKSNPLRCLDEEDEELESEEVVDKLKDCPDTLDADLRFYNTEIAMTDLDEVRVALGYDKINIYGASYGSRAAITYLRMFPEHVRTVTLDSVVDPSFVLFMTSAQDGQAALESLFARCENDEACRITFPKLRSEFNSLLSRLEESPAEISMPHPVTNQPIDLTITPEIITGMVFNTMYVPDFVATLPLSIHLAYADENYVPLIAQGLQVNGNLYDGMFYAVACTEDAPLISADEAAENSEQTVFEDRTVHLSAVCSEWQKGEVSDAFRAPITSDIPVLILSGEADPITPPYHAEKVAESLTNELHLIFDDMGHGNLNSICSMNIFNDFIETASIDGIDVSCVDAVQPPPFFIDFSGPRP